MPSGVNLPAEADPKMWGGRGGGRHYMLWRAMLELADAAGSDTFRASRRDLHATAAITSHSGLHRSIEFLVDAGLIALLDAGSGDLHPHGTDRSKGRSARYMIRQRGSTSSSSHGEPTRAVASVAHFLVFAEQEEKESGRSPLPNVDPRMDIFGDEPHLLRLVDLIIGHGAMGVMATPTAVSTLLGLSMSGAHEMISRLAKLNMVRDGVIEVEDVLYFGRGWKRSDSIARRIKREVSIRTEALAGRWVPVRMRVAQRFVGKRVGRFVRADWAAIWAVTAAQRRKAEQGGVPWLLSGELERALMSSYAGVA